MSQLCMLTIYLGEMYVLNIYITNIIKEKHIQYTYTICLTVQYVEITFLYQVTNHRAINTEL